MKFWEIYQNQTELLLTYPKRSSCTVTLMDGAIGDIVFGRRHPSTRCTICQLLLPSTFHPSHHPTSAFYPLIYLLSSFTSNISFHISQLFLDSTDESRDREGYCRTSSFHFLITNTSPGKKEKVSGTLWNAWTASLHSLSLALWTRRESN